ncbi:MAG: YitT family protein [Lachnospiraceae bacterium]|nr:YitT family protein [Lachnospiraceae bacterium]
MKTEFKTELKQLSIKNFLLLTLSGTINAVGVTMFLSPLHLYDSGFSGTAMLLEELTPSYLTLSVFLLILNIPFFLYGYKKQGLAFTVYSVYAVIIYSLASYLIRDIFPVDVATSSPFAGTDLLLGAAFGGLISGIGSGLTIRFGGAIDGVEVMAVIFAKKLGITVGTFVMAYNVVLYIVVGIAMHSWILPLYSIVTYYVALHAVDYIVEGFDKAKAAMIITTKPKHISQALSEEFGSGITLWEGHGYYSDKEKMVIYFVVNRFQIGKMKTIVQQNDENAFISITEVADVLGRNTK